jgi:hypothetical protein
MGIDVLTFTFFILGVGFSAGVTIAVLKGDMKEIKGSIQELKNTDIGIKAYMERELNRLYEKFDYRTKNLEKRVEVHDVILNLKKEKKND